MAKTISQRITLEGGDAVRKQLEELGKAGEKSFQQITDAAQKAKIDPQQYAQTRQALDGLIATGTQLANQFLALARATATFGDQGTRAAAAVATGLNQTSAAAQQTGATMAQAGQQAATAGQTAGTALISTANKWRLAAVGIVAAITAITSALTRGAAETATKIAGEAGKLQLSIEQWVALRKAIAGTGLSFDDFVKGAGKAVDLISKLKEEIARTVKSYKVLGENGETITVTVGSMASVTGEAIDAFRQLGVSMKTLQGGDTMAILREAATVIDRMRDGAQKTALGVKFFGDSWEKIIRVLAGGKQDLEDTTSELDRQRKASRELTAEQVKLGDEVTKAWDDFKAAVRATRDQVGALFFGGELAKAKWLTNLIDDSRELLKSWLNLSEAGRKAFLTGVSASPAETVLRILVALGEQLAGIWNDVLIPAGQKVLEFATGLAGSFKNITTEQVIAGFVTLTIALTGLAVAFKGVGFLLSPLTAVLSLLAGFGPILIPLIALVVLFWDQIKAGANAVAGMLPSSIEKLKDAFGLLLEGDFAGAWDLFKEAAVEAFETIRLIATQTLNEIAKIPWVTTIINGIKQIASEGPAAIGFLIDAVILLGRTAQKTADILNKVFGSELTGTDVAALAVIANYTGGFRGLAAAAQIAAAAVTILAGLFTIGGWPLAIGVALAGLGTTLLVLGEKAQGLADIIKKSFAAIPFVGLVAQALVSWEQIKAGAMIAWNAITAGAAATKEFIDKWVTQPVANAWAWITASFNDVVNWLGARMDETTAFIQKWVITPVGDAWQWIVDTATGVWERVKTLGQQAYQSIVSFVTTPVANAWKWIIDAWNATVGKLPFLRIEGGSTGSPAAPAPQGALAGGGLLGGRGTGTSDSNLAWVSRGEYITPARAVAQPGVLAFLEALRRSGGNLRDVIDGMGRFALGGLVVPQVSIPAFAGGGAMNNVTIQFPGLPEITGLRASSSVVDELRKAAAMAQVRSGGRKPSRWS